MHVTLKKTLLAAALCVPVLASAQNLLKNGSFETALNPVTDWTAGTVGAFTYPVLIVNYGPGAVSGEALPLDNAVSLSPDAVGSKAAYFVEDVGTLTLTQSFTVLTTGNYNVGFDTYVPANGFSNPFNSTFSGKVDATSVLTTSVGSLPKTTWQSNTAVVNLSAGVHTVTFSFTPSGVQAKDLVLDRVYVVATPVPEAETLAMMAAGLAAIGFIARRRTRA